VQISENFSRSEFECPCSPCEESGHDAFLIDSLLVGKLQEVRTEINQPIKINSGFRCPAHNTKVGGKTTSSHLAGKAVDIAVPGSPYRYEVLRILLTKFNRLGIGANFIHVDVDHDKPLNLIWVYS